MRFTNPLRPARKSKSADARFYLRCSSRQFIPELSCSVVRLLLTQRCNRVPAPNCGETIYKMISIVEPQPAGVDLVAQVEEMFSPKGLLSKASNFEYRP